MAAQGQIGYGKRVVLGILGVVLAFDGCSKDMTDTKVGSDIALETTLIGTWELEQVCHYDVSPDGTDTVVHQEAVRDGADWDLAYYQVMSFCSNTFQRQCYNEDLLLDMISGTGHYRLGIGQPMIALPSNGRLIPGDPEDWWSFSSFDEQCFVLEKRSGTTSYQSMKWRKLNNLVTKN